MRLHDDSPLSLLVETRYPNASGHQTVALEDLEHLVELLGNETRNILGV